MVRQFHKDLETLKERLLLMASISEAMIHDSVRILVEREEEYAQGVFSKEKEINGFHLEIDDRCLKLLALRQPMAVDLRFIISAMKINSELERIGDQAVNIVQNALSLLKHPPVKPLIDIPRMAELSKDMVRKSLDAFINRDVELARKVLLSDDEVDALKDQIFRELLTYILADASTTPKALDLILISRHLERIADHATNIAEDVIYMVLAKDIRHHADEPGKKIVISH